MDVRESAQQILDGPWRHAVAARQACRDGAAACPAFVDASAPPAPLLLGRGDFARCRQLAATTFVPRGDLPLRVIPIWMCRAYEVPENEWTAAHALQFGDEAMEFHEYSARSEPSLDTALTGRVLRWEIGCVVRTESYAPSVPLRARHGAYGVLDLKVHQIVEASATPGALLPRPTITVPMFCTWYEPRVDGLTETELRAIRAGSITVDQDGNLVARPG